MFDKVWMSRHVVHLYVCVEALLCISQCLHRAYQSIHSMQSMRAEYAEEWQSMDGKALATGVAELSLSLPASYSPSSSNFTISANTANIWVWHRIMLGQMDFQVVCLLGTSLISHQWPNWKRTSWPGPIIILGHKEVGETDACSCGYGGQKVVVWHIISAQATSTNLCTVSQLSQWYGERSRILSWINSFELG